MIDDPQGWPEIWAQFSKNLRDGWSWSGFERSTMFVNGGAADFVDLAPVLGADQVSDGRGIAVGDLDGDGDLDMVGTTSRTHPHVYVLRNDLDHERSFLMLDLVPSGNRSDAGASVRVTADGVTRRRDAALGQGFLAQHARTLHFGLGDAEHIERVEIRWPEGEEQVLEDLPINSRFVVRQGTTVLEEIELTERNATATGRLPEMEWDRFASSIRIPRGKAPKLGYLGLTDLDGEPLPIENDETETRPLLLALWATWCSNCRQEVADLNELVAESSDLVRVAALSLDEGDKADQVRAAVRDWGMAYPTGHIHERARNPFKKLLEEKLELGSRGMSLPTSLLLTPGGAVIGWVEGRVDVDALRFFLENR